MPLAATTAEGLAYFDACAVALIFAPAATTYGNCTELIARFHPYGAQSLPDAWVSVTVQEDIASQRFENIFLVQERSGETWHVKSTALPSRTEMLHYGWATVGEAQAARALDEQQHAAYQACEWAVWRIEAWQGVTSCRDLGIETAGMWTSITQHPLTSEGHQVSATTSLGDTLQSDLSLSFGYVSFVGAALLACFVVTAKQAKSRFILEPRTEMQGAAFGLVSFTLALSTAFIYILLCGTFNAVFPLGVLWLCGLFWFSSGLLWGFRALTGSPILFVQSLSASLRGMLQVLSYTVLILLGWAFVVFAWGWLLDTFFYWYGLLL